MCVPFVVLEAPILVLHIVRRDVNAKRAIAVHRSATGTPSVRLPEVDGVRSWTMRRSRPPVFRWSAARSRWPLVTRRRRVNYLIVLIHGIDGSGEERPSWRRHRCRRQHVVCVGRCGCGGVVRATGRSENLGVPRIPIARHGVSVATTVLRGQILNVDWTWPHCCR